MAKGRNSCQCFGRVSRPSLCSLLYSGVAGKGVSNPKTGKPGPTCSFPKTDWRGAVNTNRWLSLSSETSLLAAALEKYDPISALALPLRQICDVCPGDIRAFWAGKSPFRAERNRETENGRLAGGGRSPSRTLLRPNSLLTGKNTGNSALSTQTLRR